MQLLSTLLLAPLVAGNTVLFDITKSPSAQSAQLARRETLLRSTPIDKRTGLFKRAGTVTADLTNAKLQGLYFANVTVGTPGQQLQLQIDTGSSDVWVPAAEAPLCGNQQEGGCPNGQCEFFLPLYLG